MAKINNEIFHNGVTGKKCIAFFPTRGVITPIEWGSASSQSHLLRRVGEI